MCNIVEKLLIRIQWGPKVGRNQRAGNPRGERSNLTHWLLESLMGDVTERSAITTQTFGGSE
jgi:hypothetical protein